MTFHFILYLYFFNQIDAIKSTFFQSKNTLFSLRHSPELNKKRKGREINITVLYAHKATSCCTSDTLFNVKYFRQSIELSQEKESLVFYSIWQ